MADEGVPVLSPSTETAKTMNKQLHIDKNTMDYSRGAAESLQNIETENPA